MGGRLMNGMTHYTIQQQFIRNWHDDFVECIGKLLCLYDILMAMPQATEEDKRVLSIYKAFVQGKAVMDIERDLAEGIVGKSTLDKIEKMCKDLCGLALEHISMGAFEKMILKQLYFAHIEQSREAKEREMTMIGILAA